MPSNHFARSACSTTCGCVSAMGRRDFLKWIGLGAAAGLSNPWQAMAGPFDSTDFEGLIPADKKLSKQWVESLFARGERTVYSGTDLETIGMPVGGLCAGQVYLGGDGRLWHWDIFNQHIDSGSSGPHYAKPMVTSSPFDQGFAVRITSQGKSQIRPLDRRGWKDISFIGEYPIGFVQYRDSTSPVTASLQAFSPFIPLNEMDSSIPVTVMRFAFKNSSTTEVEIQMGGWLENPICLYSADSTPGSRRNRIVRQPGLTLLECSAEPLVQSRAGGTRPDITLEDFEGDAYEGWSATGEAFGRGPIAQSGVPEYQGQLGMHGKQAVNSHATAPGDTVEAKDSAVGVLTSRVFRLERDFISFLIGGGSHAGRTGLNLMVEGKTVLSATGQNENRMQPRSFDVRRWAGREARLEIVDRERGAWGNIGVDNIVLTDRPPEGQKPFDRLPDYGTMGLALLDAHTDGLPGDSKRSARSVSDNAWSDIPAREPQISIFDSRNSGSEQSVTKGFSDKMVGSLLRTVKLRPRESTVVTFLLCWHFPNLTLGGLGEHDGRWYGKRFRNTQEVAEYVAGEWDRLCGQTALWHQTWYDSTLPFWFLDRTFLNTSILATSTSYWLGNKRFYGWEGVGCCAGTCGHVWQYAQAVARLFPAFERNLREMVDYGVGFDAESGRIRFRAEHNDQWAVDAQAGVILRTFREHCMSADSSFLRRVWPSTRKALQFLISKDNNADGLIDGPQHNTLDTDWWGHVAWLSGLYLAALRAGAAMAREVEDSAFATQCETIAGKGSESMVSELFNGEYFINRVDPKHLDTINSGTGCEIDQVFGQGWAFQVGLSRVLPKDYCVKALESLWRYNFTLDVGPYRTAHRPGRWYAMPGEAGLLMCTFPKPDWDYSKAAGKGPDWAAGYFNECMNGFEYQAASHMVWEGMMLQGFAVTRAVHDRYHASRRNPWNEVECGDHYARSMASYGVFLAACGFDYHGPSGRIAFEPRLRPENFRAAFTTAEAWGTYEQIINRRSMNASLTIKWGSLRLRKWRLKPNSSVRMKSVSLRLNGKTIRCTWKQDDGTVELFAELNMLKAGDSLEVRLAHSG